MTVRPAAALHYCESLGLNLAVRGTRNQGSRANEDMFANSKAQGWWALRDRFLETYKASKGEAYDRDAIISLSPAIEELRELKSELSQVTFTYNAAGKIIVNKAPDGHSSPNRPLRRTRAACRLGCLTGTRAT